MENQTEKAMSTSVATTTKKRTPATMAGLNSGDVSGLLERMKPAIARALPKHLTADRMIQLAATLVVENPAIAKCDTKSIIGAVMQASILGFKPVSALGYCYFVPYGNKVQLQIGYKGYIDLARRTGKIKMLYAEVVHDTDEFNYEVGLHPDLTHKPNPDKEGKMTHVYAVVHYVDGGYNMYVLTKKEVEKLRMRSPSQKAQPTGAWATDYEAMAKAKAIKQLAKYMPLSDEMEQAVLSDEAIITEKALSNDHSGMREEKFEYADVVEDQVPDNVDKDTGEVKEEKPKPEKKEKSKSAKPKEEKPKADKEPAKGKRERTPVENDDGTMTVYMKEEGKDMVEYECTKEEYRELLAGNITDEELIKKGGK